MVDVASAADAVFEANEAVAVVRVAVLAKARVVVAVARAAVLHWIPPLARPQAQAA